MKFMTDMVLGLPRVAYQDGGQFYAESDGALIADYGFMVANDHDTDGARAAREQFLKAYGRYWTI